MRYSPVRHSSSKHAPEGLHFPLPFDLHVLSMPPAFNLSQDQTLQFKNVAAQNRNIIIGSVKQLPALKIRFI